MKRINVIMIMLLLVNTVKINAYWTETIGGVKIGNTLTQIGEWMSSTWESDYNLNIWEDENTLNQYIPEDTIFSYNGLLYIIIEGEKYNPYYHGLPGQPSNRWASVSIELEWRPNTNYRPNSVVIRNGRYFIANIVFNTSSWFIHDPLTNSGYQWSEWREIEPISQEHFGMLLDTGLKDYANPDFNYIIYK